MARLVIFDESVRGVDLAARPVVLGRSKQADVPIHDKILSRKHCSIEPSNSGWRVVDLGSSNGTYLNGARVESASLKLDDVIEIGNTVIILLDGKPSGSRSGLAQLRNPSKAKKLVERLKVGEPESSPTDAGPRAPRRPSRKLEKSARRAALVKDRRKLRAFEAVFAKWAGTELLARPEAQALLEGYVAHHVVSVAAKHSGELRGLLTAVLERVFAPDASSRSTQTLEATIHEAVAEALARHRNASDRRA